MELVEGPTLAEVIAAGTTDIASGVTSVASGFSRTSRGLPIEEALPIAKQIAEALEAAHEQGIIHRDLKPANIKVRDDGTVKVLDFGLAKAMEPAGPASASASMSPTITTPAMTQAGIIFGTAAYMSPKQAKGRAVDRRSDLWALGCVLFEMLSGVRAFEGEDIADTLGDVLKVEPNWNALPDSVFPRVRRVLHACLQKNPKQWIDSAQALRPALDGAFETSAPVTAGRAPTPRGRVLLGVGAGLIVGALVAAAALRLADTRASAPAPIERVSRRSDRYPTMRKNGCNAGLTREERDARDRPLATTIPDMVIWQWYGQDDVYPR